MQDRLMRNYDTVDSEKLVHAMLGYEVVLFSDFDEMYSLFIPTISEGFYKFTNHPEFRVLSIESKRGIWVARCNHPAFFQNVAPEQYNEVPLVGEQLLTVEYEDRSYSLYVEQISRDKKIFKNFHVDDEAELIIGNLPNNDIYYRNPFVAETHAILTRSEGKWHIKNCDAINGVYVNGRKIESSYLQIGDVIYIMGLRIIIGTSFISINDCVKTVVVNKQHLQDIIPYYGGYSTYSGQTYIEPTEQYFNRSPRKRIEIPQKTISIEGPPMSMERSQMPLMLRMGSSMLMGGAAALAGNFITLLTSVLFPVLSSKYTEKQKQDYERLRVTKYTEYLEKKRHEIIDAIADEQQLLNHKYPTLSETVLRAKQKARLWERRPIDNDFLHIRLGTGAKSLGTVIDYPQRRFELESDILEEKMYQLAEKPYYVEHVPVILSLADFTVCGLVGPKDNVLEYILQMVLQISVFHSYDEVKVAFLLRNKEFEKLDIIRYLPHVWDDQRTIRLIATDESEAYTLGEYIKNQIVEDDRSETDLHQILKTRPFYVIFVLDKKLLESHEVYKNILQEEQNLGVSIIAAYDDLPKETQKIITLRSDGKNICTTMAVDGGEDVQFQSDCCNYNEAVETMRMLANTSLKTVTQVQSIPKMITFLEMFKVGRIEQLNPLKRWRDNNPVISLAAPVGVGADGSLFALDLHEKRQGPHGLVAGMTGSGKSEFIITYILSMAVNYHPDEVAFVLIDYKGGGLAGAFENPDTGIRLPHLVGTITNLDGVSIQRSLMSIESELIRRQKIFNDVKRVVNDGTMDIYAYQKLYREGVVSEAVPHLFIISDEFAELKQQQPEFMAKLISAARIGRSLGVHLILATQKPSGIVDDQIRSNTKFRVCLRVQERSDSMDMLKRPEAAELTDTGRFYLQVGYNEYFAMGQSAWCGADYEPQNSVVVRTDDEIEFLTTTGQIITKAKPAVRKTASGMKQIVAVVRHLAELAESQGIKTRQLWQPELPKLLDSDELNKEYNPEAEGSMSVCLGLVDDPENQTQFPLKIDFRTCQNMLIAGESGSGKTTLVQNILYTLVNQLEPQDFNFYVLDYSSRMLKIFSKLPHCGAVLQEEDAESLDEFFKMINSIVAERKRLFSKLEVDSFEAARSVSRIPLILVVIDNYSGLSSSKQGENHGYKMQSYLKNGATYGIKYIITCSHLNEVPLKTRQELVERLCLHIRDKYDYNELLGGKAEYIPPEISGRGLCKCGERILEFQSAIIRSDIEDRAKTIYLKDVLDMLQTRQNNRVEARRLPVMSENATYEEFACQFTRKRIPLGISMQNNKKIALPFKQFSALSVYLGNPQGAKIIIENFIHAAKRECMDVWITKRKENSCFNAFDNKDHSICVKNSIKIFSLEPQSLNSFRTVLTEEIAKRNTMLKEYCSINGITGDIKARYQKTFEFLCEKTKPILVIIESFADFCSIIDNISELIYDKAFSVAQRRNIYVVGCFEPEDYCRVENKLLYFGFNPDGNILLLGGQFDKQKLCSIPTSTEFGKILPYNVGIMGYRNRFHPILMPSGEVITEYEDEDEKDIF